MENLHGDTGILDAYFINEYVKVEENDPNLMNAMESIFSTRLTEQVYCGLIKLMKSFSPTKSVAEIEKALVSLILNFYIYFQVHR